MVSQTGIFAGKSLLKTFPFLKLISTFYCIILLFPRIQK